MRNRKTKQPLVEDNEQVARIALYLPQLHAQKAKLEAADLQELEHLALSGWGCAEICPHGRPIVKRLTLIDLLREFGRI